MCQVKNCQRIEGAVYFRIIHYRVIVLTSIISRPRIRGSYASGEATGILVKSSELNIFHFKLIKDALALNSCSLWPSMSRSIALHLTFKGSFISYAPVVCYTEWDPHVQHSPQLFGLMDRCHSTSNSLAPLGWILRGFLLPFLCSECSKGTFQP